MTQEKKTNLDWLSRQISVIMPCYNGEKYIRKSIQSVLNQTYKNLELIVVDDGSTDASLSILKQMREGDERIKILRQENKGPGPARNKALSEATGEYIAFLDADDYWATEFLEKLERTLRLNHDSKWGLAYCGWQNIGLNKKKSQPFIPPDYSSFDLSELFIGGCRWPIHGVLVQKACIDRVNGFDEQWTTCMDYDLWLRMTPFIKAILVPEVLVYYRHHEGEQITKNRALLAENHWEIQKKFIRAEPGIRSRIGEKRIKQLVHGELLNRAYICYWERDLEAAHRIFRLVMKTGYGTFRDWKYILPAILPLFLYKKIVSALGR